MDTDLQRPNSPFASVRIKEFRYFITQRFFFIMAMRMVSTLVLWKMYLLTKSPLQVSLVGLSEAIPAISLSLYSGHVVDKSDKRTLLFRSILLYLLCVVSLLAVTYHDVEASMGKRFVQYGIYLIIFCTGIIRSFSGPSSSSILAQLVPKPMLPNAVTWSSTTWLTGSVLGHGSAGLLIAYAGYSPSFLVIMTYLIIASLSVWLIKPKPILHVNAGQKTWESVKEGLKYVLATKELLSAFTLDMFAVLFGGVAAMIPFFAGDILHAGPIGFGWLNAAADIGAISVIITLIFSPIRRKQGRILLYVVAGYGLCIITFGVSEIFWLSFLALLASGVLDGISMIIRGTILQMKTPDNMRGRVSSVNSMFINSSNEIGQVESGLAATLLGKVPSVIFGGSMTLLVVGAMWWKAPKLRKFEY